MRTKIWLRRQFLNTKISAAAAVGAVVFWGKDRRSEVIGRAAAVVAAEGGKRDLKLKDT